MITASLVGLCVSGSGCKERNAASPSESTAVAPARAPLPVAPNSDFVRAEFQRLGVALPDLRLMLRRKGRDFLAFQVASDEALRTWERLRALTESTGYYPLIVRDEHGMLTDLTDEDLTGTPEECIKLAQTFDVEGWFEARRKEISENDPEAQIPRGPAQAVSPNRSFVVPYDTISGKPVNGVYILLVPTRNGCEVPALLMLGGWNECPGPVVHVALLRSWRDRYGAEPVTFGGDVLELRVTRRPETQQEALRLAEEQYLYCNDIVEQGVANIDALAATLLASDIWFFWWD